MIVSSGRVRAVPLRLPRATKSLNVIETAGYATAEDGVTVSLNRGATSVSVR